MFLNSMTSPPGGIIKETFARTHLLVPLHDGLFKIKRIPHISVDLPQCIALLVVVFCWGVPRNPDSDLL